MSQIDHNGEDFEYVVTYRPRDDSSDSAVTKVVDDWMSNRIVISNQPTFQTYIITLIARNALGDGPQNSVIGYSGEDGKSSVIGKISVIGKVSVIGKRSVTCKSSVIGKRYVIGRNSVIGKSSVIC